ncbi:MAG TPA: VOC family protein, partial [Burkholderiaceae bacterium]|nr:VOC family protein [Burkholderiaceae bacterium]
MRCELDHLVVACKDLDQGAAWVVDRLGIEPQPGGKHTLMGTHNRLLRLGPGSFFELIAIDPDAPPPARPRWFGLDSSDLQARLAESPQLLTWVVRTDKIAEAVTRVPELGQVHPA